MVARMNADIGFTPGTLIEAARSIPAYRRPPFAVHLPPWEKSSNPRAKALMART